MAETNLQNNDITCNCDTLYERIERGSPHRFTEQMQQSFSSQIANWRHNAAGGDENLFSRRLEWDGIVDPTACFIFGDGQHPNNKAPHWVTIFNDCINIFDDPLFLKTFSREHIKYSFEQNVLSLAKAIAERGLYRLKKMAGAYIIEMLRPEALKNLKSLLIKRIAAIFTPPLEIEYRQYSYLQESTLTSKIRELEGNSRSFLCKFFENVLDQRLELIFKNYPYLARVMAETIEEWCEATHEFLTRLAQDMVSLKTISDFALEKIKVSAIQGGISDLHHGGRSVLLVTFSNDTKVVYKPRDIGLEKAFNMLLKWISERGLKPKLKVLKVLAYTGYGWIEYVEHLDCLEEAELQEYFYRCGMLLFLCYILEGTDIHHENIIACGSDPVIVDLETILHPQYPNREQFNEESAHGIAGTRIWKSVLRTMMLPNWLANHEGQEFNLSGVSMGEIDLTFEGNRGNTPTLNGKAISAESFRETIVSGFKVMGGFFLEHKHEICAPNGPLSGFLGKQVRFILRPTKVYNQLINKLLSPECLRIGINAGIVIDSLAITFLHNKEKPPDWPILKSEHNRLRIFNIPYFSTYTTATSLYTDDGVELVDYFKKSSFSETLNNVEQLTKIEIEEQVQFINNSFHSFRALPDHSLKNIDYIKLQTTSDYLLSSNQLLSEAENIGNSLIRTAIASIDGSSAWIGMQFIPILNRYEFQVIDHGLYSGNVGISLFFACLARATGKEHYLRACNSGLQLIRSKIRNDPIRYARVLGLGGYTGIPSIAYGIYQSGLILNDEALMDDAQIALAAIQEESIKSDQNLDIILGTAGTLLVLLSTFKYSINDRLMHLAKACGDHLLKNLPCHKTQSLLHKSWTSFPRTGFSHGAAGIAWSLMSLFAKTRDKRYRNGVDCLVEYENSYLNRNNGNWLDGNEKGVFYGGAWCHGAPGIALSRLRCLSIEQEASFHSDAHMALKSEVMSQISKVDNLCCGTAGKLLILLEAARVFEKQFFINKAHTFSGLILKKAWSQNSAYDLVPGLPSFINNPSLMQGLAGIGFAFLSLLPNSEEYLPRLLSLEGPPKI